MPKFTVTVEFTEIKRKQIAVFARDRQEAEERAVSRVSEWEGVTDAEAKDVEEN